MAAKNDKLFRRLAAAGLGEFLRLFRLFLVLVLVLVSVLAYQYYQPIAGQFFKTYDPESNVTAFNGDWDISGPFNGWSTAGELALLCEIAYEPLETAKQHFLESDFSSVEYFNADGYAKQPAYAVTGERNGKRILVIVFPGSNDPSDWLQNVNFYSGGADTDGVHQGFAGAFADNRKQIKDVATDKSIDQIWITGHSMGGALAVICAEYLSKDEVLNTKLKGVFAFAQPMVARSDYASLLSEQLGDRHVHFINDRDVIPRLAPGYEHTGMMIYLNGDKVMIPERYLKKAKENPLDAKNPDLELASIFQSSKGLEALDKSYMAQLQLAVNQIELSRQPQFEFKEMLAQAVKSDKERILKKYITGNGQPLLASKPSDALVGSDEPDSKESDGELTQGLGLKSQSPPLQLMAEELASAERTREEDVRKRFYQEELQRKKKATAATSSFLDLLGFEKDHSIIEYRKKIDSVTERISKSLN